MSVILETFEYAPPPPPPPAPPPTELSEPPFPPPPPPPITSMVLLASLLQSAGTVQLVPDVRKTRHCPPPISVPASHVIARAGVGRIASGMSARRRTRRREIDCASEPARKRNTIWRYSNMRPKEHLQFSNRLRMSQNRYCPTRKEWLNRANKRVVAYFSVIVRQPAQRDQSSFRHSCGRRSRQNYIRPCQQTTA